MVHQEIIREEIHEDDFNQLREASKDFSDESCSGISASLNDRDSDDDSDMTLPNPELFTLEARQHMNPSDTLQYSES